MILCLIEWVVIGGFIWSWFSHDCDEESVSEFEEPDTDRPNPPGRFR